MARAEQASISNLALGLVGLFACVVLGSLGLLLYKIRARHAPPVVVAARMEKNSAPQNDSDAPVIRVSMRAPVAIEKETETIPAAAVVETPAAPGTESAAPNINETPLEVPAVKIADGQGNLVPMKSEASDEFIPEITGMSYTTKKLLANGMDPNNLGKPGDNKPVSKKPEVKKPVVPIPPKPPAKPEIPKPVAKPATPSLPPLPAAGDGKIDLSKFPVYVLNDGRRIRALISRESNGVISVRNEAGTEVSFKKTDVKEVVKK